MKKGKGHKGDAPPANSVSSAAEASRHKTRTSSGKTAAEQSQGLVVADWAAVFNALSDAIFTADAETGMLLEANQNAQRLVGRSLEEICRMHYSELHPPEQVPQLRSCSGRSRSKSNPWPRGSACWGATVGEFRWRSTGAFFEIDGRHVVLGVFRSLTERQQAEELLRQANFYNRSLIEASLDPLVTIGPDGRITDVNTATEAVTGRSRRDLIGTDFSDYFTDPERARAGYQRVFRDGVVRDYPLEIRHRDGQVDSRAVQCLGVPRRGRAGRRRVCGRAGCHPTQASGGVAAVLRAATAPPCGTDAPGSHRVGRATSAWSAGIRPRSRSSGTRPRKPWANTPVSSCPLGERARRGPELAVAWLSMHEGRGAEHQ